jgi:hypothetical protein
MSVRSSELIAGKLPEWHEKVCAAVKLSFANWRYRPVAVSGISPNQAKLRGWRSQFLSNVWLDVATATMA